MDFLSRSSASLLDKLSKKSSTQKAGLIYAVSIGSLVAYNIRWKYLLPSLLGIKARKLPFTKKVATGDIKYISIILLHGMWHDSSYYAELQDILAKEGYASYAIDLLPGERFSRGGSQQELVQDLEYTLEDIEGPYILLGHSQGGLVVQAALQKSDVIRKTAEGVVLLGTYPLGLTPPVSAILKEKRTMYMDLGYAFFCFFGKLMNTRYTKHIFLLPNTDEMSEEVSSYIAKLLKVRTTIIHGYHNISSLYLRHT
jgi:pimeloyl-ACP methyl ester carboxylesterase